MAQFDTSQRNGSDQKTVLLVFPADRGHFTSCIPLATELKRRNFFVELWTHSVSEVDSSASKRLENLATVFQWTPDGVEQDIGTGGDSEFEWRIPGAPLERI